jgi:hypothetical protein
MRCRGCERFFDALNAGPSQHECRTTSLVVRAAGACATEGLLPDHGPSAFVIDVKVTSAVAKCS